MSIDNVFDEELDYEMDDHNEEQLLQSDEDVNDCEIVRLMSSTSVSSEVEKELDTSATVESVASEVLIAPLYPIDFKNSKDLMEKSISTYSAIINKNVTSPTNELRTVQEKVLVPPKEMKIQEQGRQSVSYDDIMELDTLQSTALNLSKKVPFIEVNGTAEFPEVNKTNGFTNDLSSKCDSPSKSYEVNGVNVHFENTVQFISNGKLNQPYTKSTTFDKTSSNRNATKKIPFIIHAQANGTSARSVVINPSFEGFSKARQTERPHDRWYSPYKRNVDLRDKILKRREPSNTLIASSMTIKNDQESPKEIPFLTDEEKDYLMEIEKQKLKREQIIRQKEMRRERDGWNFNK